MRSRCSLWPLALGLVLGLATLGYAIHRSALDVKEYERTVTVKGLAEREMPADRVIWPITFTVASNDLNALYQSLETGVAEVRAFLSARGIAESEVTASMPSITDKSAQNYGGPAAEFRYSANRTVTVYSGQVDSIRSVMADLPELGKRGLVITGNEYGDRTEYLFSGLNEIKPRMVEEATRQARQVAEKFAADSESRLGKIRRASQGQFSIQPRDTNNPHIKRIRVVSTIEYYLAD